MAPPPIKVWSDSAVGFFVLFVCLVGFFNLWQMEVPQARGRIGGAVASLCHSHSKARSKPHLRPMLQLPAMWVLNPRIKARDQMGILMDTSQVLHPCATWELLTVGILLETRRVHLWSRLSEGLCGGTGHVGFRSWSPGSPGVEERCPMAG